MDGIFDLFGRESAIVIGLLLPFLGLLVPALVLLGIGLSHRIAPHAAVAPAEGAAGLDGLPLGVVEAVAEAADKHAASARGDQSWLTECLRESDIFQGLTDDELRLVADIGHEREVPAGGRLASAGSRGDHLFLIIAGEIRLLSHPPAETVVRTARAGETVPLAAIIDPPVLVTTVEAGTDCEVYAIPRQQLIDLLEMNPMMGFQVYRAVARSFEHRYRRTLDHGDSRHVQDSDHD